MPAYFYGEFDVTDPVGVAPYRQAVAETIARHGGRFIVRGGAVTLAEGEPYPRHHVVIVEFPDIASLHRWYDSPEYKAILPSRLSSTAGRWFAVEGLDAP
jgi:uncharacterized protein (DUF1330 family)